MPALTPTIQDIKASEPIPPGRYRAKVEKHEEKVSKPNKDTGETSMNDWVHFEILDSGDFSGRKLRHCFSEKEPNRRSAIQFFQALGADVVPGESYKFENAPGRELYIFVRQELYDGKMLPKISDFQKID
jgi:hypothetical protein